MVLSEGRVIPFLTVGDDSETNPSFILNPEALTLLEAVTGKVSVVVVAGKYRTGKSFLLNRLLGLKMGKTAGFQVSGAVQACTQGINMWTIPLQYKTPTGDSISVFFFDTEGLGSSIRSKTQTMKIFALALLCSSLFIFNGLHEIDEYALELLSFVANLSQHIRVRAKDGDGGGDEGRLMGKGVEREEREGELAEYAPSFIWLLRDFHLDLEGRTAKDYLDEALAVRPEPSSTSSTSSTSSSMDDNLNRNVGLNKIRRSLTWFFRDRHCVTMVRPVNDESQLQKLESLSDASLRPQFLSDFNQFKDLIFHKLRPMSMQGQYFNGRMLATLAKQYAHAIVSGAVPVISTAWSAIVTEERSHAVAQARSSFTSAMSALEPRLPLNDDVIADAYRVALKQSKIILKTMKIGDGWQQYKQEILTEFQDIYSQLVKKNASISSDSCKKILKKEWMIVYSNITNGKYSQNNGVFMSSDWQTCISNYLKEAQGPSRSPVLFAFLTAGMTDGLTKLAETTKKLQGERESQMEAQILELNVKLSATLLQLEEMRAMNSKSQRQVDTVNIDYAALQEKMITLEKDLRMKEKKLGETSSTTVPEASTAVLSASSSVSKTASNLNVEKRVVTDQLSPAEVRANMKGGKGCDACSLL